MAASVRDHQRIDRLVLMGSAAGDVPMSEAHKLAARYDGTREQLERDPAPFPIRPGDSLTPEMVDRRYEASVRPAAQRAPHPVATVLNENGETGLQDDLRGGAGSDPDADADPSWPRRPGPAGGTCDAYSSGYQAVRNCIRSETAGTGYRSSAETSSSPRSLGSSKGHDDTGPTPTNRQGLGCRLTSLARHRGRTRRSRRRRQRTRRDARDQRHALGVLPAHVRPWRRPLDPLLRGRDVARSTASTAPAAHRSPPLHRNTHDAGTPECRRRARSP